MYEMRLQALEENARVLAERQRELEERARMIPDDLTGLRREALEILDGIERAERAFAIMDLREMHDSLLPQHVAFLREIAHFKQRERAYRRARRHV
jgi:predicted nuclease with TOPRIM domain